MTNNTHQGKHQFEFRGKIIVCSKKDIIDAVRNARSLLDNVDHTQLLCEDGRGAAIVDK